MTQKPVADAALPISQRVSFAGGDRQKWVFDLFIFFFLSPPATAYKIFPNRLKSCSPMQRLWKNFPWKKCFQSKKISPVPTPTGVSNDGVGRSDSHHENSQGIQFCNRCKRSTLFELQYDIRGQIFEVSQKSTVKS